MFKKEGPICPLIGKACIEGGCKFWTHILGKSPQTGNPIDHYDCAVVWLPVLLIENSQEVRQGAAATESFRNEVVKRQDAALEVSGFRQERLTNGRTYGDGTRDGGKD
jgi:hypothetical protein